MNKLELKRQAFHLILGIVLVLLLMKELLNTTSLFVAIIVGIFISLLARNYEIALITPLLNQFERKRHIHTFPGKGIIFYFIGVFLVVSFFPLDIALASILVLAFADSASHVFGVHFGRMKHPFSDRKNIEGMCAGLIAGFVGALVFLPWQESLAAALAAMIIEGIELKFHGEEVDDNILMPLAAALAISLTRFFM